jgi:hypothetical protein
LALFKINWKRQAKNTPNATKSWLNEPKVPDRSFGDNYLIIKGAIAL